MTPGKKKFGIHVRHEKYFKHNLIDCLFSTGAMENVRLAAIVYSLEYPGHNYFQDWIEIHSVLGQTVEYRSVIFIASFDLIFSM